MQNQIDDIRERIRSDTSRRVAGTTVMQDFNGIDSWVIRTELRDSSWQVTHEKSRRMITSAGYSQRIGEGHSNRPHPAVSLIYSDSMFIWGAPDADWYPGWVEDSADGAIIGLRHRAERSLLASITYDKQYNLFTRFDAPTRLIHLRDLVVSR